MTTVAKAAHEPACLSEKRPLDRCDVLLASFATVAKETPRLVAREAHATGLPDGRQWVPASSAPGGVAPFVAGPGGRVHSPGCTGM